MNRPPLARSSGLDRRLAADLSELVADLRTEEHARTSLAMLQRHLLLSVPAALGLTLVVPPPATGASLRVNLLPRTLRPEEVAAVLEVPLEVLLPGAAGAVVLYASHARAFDHLGPLLDVESGLLRRGQTPTAELHPGIESLAARTALDRRLGVLLNRGHDLAEHA